MIGASRGGHAQLEHAVDKHRSAHTASRHKDARALHADEYLTRYYTLGYVPLGHLCTR